MRVTVERVRSEQRVQLMERARKLMVEAAALLRSDVALAEIDVDEGDSRMAKITPEVCLLTSDVIFSAAQVRSVTFRPYPSKYDGAWRVEVCLVGHPQCGGLEFYVSEEKLFAVLDLD